MPIGRAITRVIGRQPICRRVTGCEAYSSLRISHTNRIVWLGAGSATAMAAAIECRHGRHDLLAQCPHFNPGFYVWPVISKNGLARLNPKGHGGSVSCIPHATANKRVNPVIIHIIETAVA